MLLFPSSPAQPRLLKWIVLFGLMLTTAAPSLVAQTTTLYYPLKSHFDEASLSGPSLSPWANDLGLEGSFGSQSMPLGTCGGLGSMDGYFYEDNAGVAFDFPAALVGCEYTLQWTWMFDDMSGWVRILSFLHEEDAGLFVQPNLVGVNGTATAWYLSPFPFFPGFCPPAISAMGAAGALEPGVLYQMTLTRTCTDLLSLYVNGALLGTFSDTDDKYLPQGPTPRLVLFRDTASVLTCYPATFSGEASAGFVSDLIISDAAMTSTQVSGSWSTFCPAVLSAQLLKWEGSIEQDGHQLQWQWEAAGVGRRVWVEHRSGGEAFRTLGEAQAETFFHWQPGPGEHHYRLRWENGRGGFVYSSVLTLLRAPGAVRIGPNPASDVLEVRGMATTSSVNPRFEVLDMQGRRVTTPLVVDATPAAYRIEVGSLSPGLYLLRWQQEGQAQVHRFMKQ